MRSEHHIHPGSLLDDLALILLRQTAPDGDLHPRVRLLDRNQVTEVSVEPIVGVLANGTGVEDHHIGLLALGHRHIARILEQASQTLRVVDVHLAAVSAHLIRPTKAHRPGDLVSRHPASLSARGALLGDASRLHLLEVRLLLLVAGVAQEHQRQPDEREDQGNGHR